MTFLSKNGYNNKLPELLNYYYNYKCYTKNIVIFLLSLKLKRFVILQESQSMRIKYIFSRL